MQKSFFSDLTYQSAEQCDRQERWRQPGAATGPGPRPVLPGAAEACEPMMRLWKAKTAAAADASGTGTVVCQANAFAHSDVLALRTPGTRVGDERVEAKGRRRTVFDGADGGYGFQKRLSVARARKRS